MIPFENDTTGFLCELLGGFGVWGWGFKVWPH